MISIIVPVYNAEKYLNRCIKSMINQTYKDIEIVLVDDGSTDNSNAICKQHMLVDSRIKLIEKKNGGLVSAVKTGIIQSKGEYLAFLDSDDYMEPECLYKVFAIFQLYDVDMVQFDYTAIYENKSIIRRNNIKAGLSMDLENIENAFATERCISPCRWTKVIKRNIVANAIADYDEKLFIGEDICFTLGILKQLKSLYYINEPLVNYNRIGLSMSNNYDRKYLDGYINLHTALLRTGTSEQDVNAVFFNNMKTLVQTIVAKTQKNYRQELKYVLNDGFVKKIIKDALVSGRKDKILKFLFLHKKYILIKILCKINDRGYN